MKHYDRIILGAGASGLMCASQSAKQGRRVLLLDHSHKAGRKLLASGGGNCNFTNKSLAAKDFHCKNPHFVKSALSRFGSAEMLDWAQSHGIRHYEKKLGQLFCKEGAEAIHQALMKDCQRFGVTLRLNEQIGEISREEGFFQVKTKNGLERAKELVVATGGLSFPGLGASDLGYKVAKNFGLKIEPTRPALVPLLLAGHAELAGISLPVSLQIQKHLIEDDLLFTHKGLSGPVILKASLYWSKGEAMSIDLLPGIDLSSELELLKKDHKSLKKALSRLLPEKLVTHWLKEVARIGSDDLHNLSAKQRTRLMESLHSWRITPSGTEGYKKAEITLGGVSTSDLNSKTMESKKVNGLYFIGEVIDVSGQLGGYNLHWAWASAMASLT